MLPDWPELKAELSGVLNVLLEERVKHHLGSFSDIGEMRAFEGDREIIVREDKTEQQTEKRQISTSFFIEDAEVPGMKPLELWIKLDEAAKDIASQMKRHIFEEVGNAATSVGNAINAEGNPVSPALVLKSLRQVHIEFGSDGKPNIPKFYPTSPAMYEALQNALNEIAETPELQKQVKAILEQKRLEHREREASRKLVG